MNRKHVAKGFSCLPHVFFLTSWALVHNKMMDVFVPA